MMLVEGVSDYTSRRHIQVIVGGNLYSSEAPANDDKFDVKTQFIHTCYRVQSDSEHIWMRFIALGRHIAVVNRIGEVFFIDRDSTLLKLNLPPDCQMFIDRSDRMTKSSRS